VVVVVVMVLMVVVVVAEGKSHTQTGLTTRCWC
jgi:hypothetical protein